MRGWLTGVALLLAAAHPSFAQQVSKPALPEGVTSEMIERGQRLFAGPGLCTVCHGPDAKGLPNLGPDLTDREWLHSDGTFEGILATIQSGVPADKSKSGTVMPPKGGSTLTDVQLRAVAAYVWSLSQPKR